MDHWGEKHQTVSPAQVAKYLDQILATNASVNMYMFEGGTSFGYMNGEYAIFVITCEFHIYAVVLV